jgi:hypothetical protein
VPVSEFIKESWKAVVYVLLVFIFLLNVVYVWHNYHEALGFAYHVREARMAVEAALGSWGGGGEVDLSRVSGADLPEGTVASIYYANGSLAKRVSS